MITEIEHRLHKELLDNNLVNYRDYLWGSEHDIDNGAPWSPLTNKGEAMALLEIMRKRGYDIVIATCGGCNGQIGTWAVDVLTDDHGAVMVHDNNLCVAICKAIIGALDDKLVANDPPR